MSGPQVIDLLPRQLARLLGVGRSTLRHRVEVIKRRPGKVAAGSNALLESAALAELRGAEAVQIAELMLNLRLLKPRYTARPFSRLSDVDWQCDLLTAHKFEPITVGKFFTPAPQ